MKESKVHPWCSVVDEIKIQHIELINQYIAYLLLVTRIIIPLINDRLIGCLNIPRIPRCLILFVHGSGSNRFSVRNNYLSDIFVSKGFATLLIDLLTENEKEIDAQARSLRFRIDLLTERLILISEWILKNPLTEGFPICYFSSSTGSAAALNASVKLNNLNTIISRGGRLDLVQSSTLQNIKIPILLLVGEKDYPIISINRKAYGYLNYDVSKELIIVPGASHYFEELGKLDEVATNSVKWLLRIENGGNQVTNFRVPIQRNFLPKIFTSLFGFQIKNRQTAGKILADLLSRYKKQDNIVIFGIPRGGVIIADQLSKALNQGKFDLALSRKIRSPFNTEKALGAISGNECLYWNTDSQYISKLDVEDEISTQVDEIKYKLLKYKLKNTVSNIENKIIILADDGADTGSTLMAAIRWIKIYKPLKIVIAIPVIPKLTLLRIQKEVDEVEFILSPRNFTSVEDYYRDFRQIEDEEVLDILEMVQRTQ